MHYSQQKNCILDHRNIDRDRVCFLVREYGGPASICYLDRSWQFFCHEGIDGAIGFKIVCGCAVVMGDPLCRQEDKIPLSLAFKTHMQRKNVAVIYITASETFTTMSRNIVHASSIEVVDELVCTTDKDPKIGIKGKRLRGKVNQARRSGVTTHTYTPWDPQIESEMEILAKKWLSERRGPQIYLSAVELFSIREGKRWIYAKQNNTIVGVALLQQMKASQGWLLQFLLTTQQAPYGTSELLIDSCLSILKEEGCPFFSFGCAQKKQIGAILGLSKTSTILTKLIYQGAQKIFPLSQRRRFWMKFSPQSAPAFLLFEKNKLSLKEIYAVMRAVNARI